MNNSKPQTTLLGKFVEKAFERLLTVDRKWGQRRAVIRTLFLLFVLGWIAVFHRPNFFQLPFPKSLLIFFSPQSLLVLLSIFLPYYIARYVATRYIEDIYEISDALRSKKAGFSVASKFLMRAAFADNYGSSRRNLRDSSRILAIVDGEVVDRRSPLLLVGGPGYVFISADSAAVFEQPDGTLRVVGPTGQRLYLMRGFERLRRIISLREHQLSVSIKTRSRDGIPIEIKDVQLLFSIYRGRRPPTHQTPYPFAPEALRQLVFNEMASPLTDRWEALASSRLLTNAMRNVARSTLNAFIHSQTVVEFMASVSSADWETLEEVYRQVANELQSVSHRNGLTFQPPPHPAPPAFVPRPQITERFQNFLNSERGRNALAKGVGIEWVGIGAWHTPVSKVIDQHLDAWRLSISNVLRSSPGTLKQLEYQRRLSAFAEYTRELLARFYQTTDQDSLQRQAILLKYFLDRLEAAALLRYGGLNHAPAAWRQAADRLRAILPHNVLS